MSDLKEDMPSKRTSDSSGSSERRAAMKKLGKYALGASAVAYTLTAKGEPASQACNVPPPLPPFCPPPEAGATEPLDPPQ